MSDTERAAWRQALDGEHLSPEDLAKREGVALDTVYQWNRKGTGPRRMKIGMHVRYKLSDVLIWEESRYVTSRAG